MAINWQYRISLQSSRTLYMGILIFLMILPSFNTSAASEKVSLQLAWKHQFQFAGYYAALHKGYYRQAGLEVKIIEGGKGKFAREEVLKDRSQYGVAGSELILHRKDGDPFVVLAPIFQHSASILLSRKDSGISNLQDMITKRVMMLPENKDADILVAFLNEGIALDQIRRLDQTYNLNDLIEGRTDVVSAYSTNEPWSLLQKNIEPVIISPQTYGVDFYSDCLFTTQSEVEDHQQRVKSFLEASILGWEYAMDHPEEIIDLLLTDYGVKKKRDHLLYEAEGIRKIMMPDLVQIGHMNPGRWAHIKTTYAKLGLIDVDFSLEGFLYDPRPEFDYIWLRKVIFATISIIVILGIGALALLFFNRKLTLEIGERKRAEVKLRNSERLHTEAQRVSKIGHWALDSPSGVPLWSEEIFHIFGLDPEKDEPSFMAHKDIIYNADWDLLNSSIQDLSLKGIPFDIEFRILRSNGQMGWMHSIGSVDKSEHGSVHRMFGTAQDVTERKQVEEALKKSEKKYQTIMESMKEPLYINSLEFSVEYMNPAMIKRTGHDATGEKCFKAIHDLDERCPWCHYEDVMDDNTYELDAVSPKDNHSFHISVTPIVNNDGSISSLNVFRDVSEFKEMEAQVQQSQKMESIGTLAGGIAHDFNNILFPIMGHSEMLLEDVPEDNPIRSSLDQIYTSAMRASELVKQILTFSRQETGELKLMKIQPIIKEVLKLIRSTIPTTIEIKQDISPACDVIKADPTQIHQIVMNLTTNAYHAMEETGGELKVGLKLGCPNPPFFLAHFLDRNFVFDHLFSNSCIFKNFSNIKIQ